MKSMYRLKKKGQAKKKILKVKDIKEIKCKKL